MVLFFLLYKILLHWFKLLTGHVLSYIRITYCPMIAMSSRINVSISDVLGKKVEDEIFQRVLNECNKWRKTYQKAKLK